MESLVNYSSEDEAEMENSSRKRDDSSKNRDGRRRSDDAWPSGSEGRKARKDDTNYESVQMDMSEDSEASSRDGRDAPSPKPKSYSRPERRRSYSADNERETPKYKASKEHHRSSKSRDYREKEKTRERDRDRDRGDRERRHRVKHSERKNKDSRRERERERHRRRSSSRERRRRSSSRESRRHRSRSHSRSHGRSRRTPDVKSSPSAPSVVVPVTPANPPAVAQPLPSPTLIPTVSVPVNVEVKPERLDWRTQQRVQQLEKMGIDLKKSETAAVELPSYYNPGVVNPSRYAEQMQKRKLLWSHKKTDNVEQAAAKWESAKFSQDQDGKVASKFMRLMGIKEPPKAGGSGVDLVKKQEELFSTMEQQYEVARQVTHTMRGVGLGFTSQRPF